MADPAPVAQTFFMDDTCQEHYRLDGIVTCVDAKYIEQHLDEEKPEGTVNESQRQLAFADRIIINKVDLVPDEEALVRVEERVRHLNEFAPMMRCEQSKVSVDYVLNIRAFNLKELLIAEPTFLRKPAKTKHDKAISSIGVNVAGDVDMEAMQEWIGALLEEKASDMYRMKGILAVDGVKQRYVYHAVHMVVQGEFMEPWGEDEERGCKLIFIGKDLDHDALIAGMNECMATPENKQKRIDKLRFAIGDRVMCNTGDGWLGGVVVAHFYRNDSFPLGKTVPYQIKLDGVEELIFSPVDDDRAVRKEVTCVASSGGLDVDEVLVEDDDDDDDIDVPRVEEVVRKGDAAST